MAFIFILLYIAVMTILQSSNFQTKKLLAAVIIVALLVNFSFFLTGIVIDASNILALFIYNAITQCPVNITCSAVGGIRPLSEVFMEGLELTSLSSRLSFEFLRPVGSSFEIVLNFFMQGILYIVAASALFAGAILFILRVVILIFILILSPIAFVALALPGTNQYWKDWLHKLMGNAFVAPVYLLLIAIVIAIIDSKSLAISANPSGSPAAAVSIAQPAPDSFGIILTYILVLGLIQGSLIISKRMAGDIANLAVKWTGKVTGMAVAGGIGLNAMVFRTGFRGFGQAMNKLTREVTKESSAVKRAAKATGTFSAKMATLSMDPRSTRLGKAAVSELKSSTGVDVGKAKTGVELDKERIKKAVAKAGKIAEEVPTAEEQNEMEVLYSDLSDAKEKLVEARTKEDIKLMEGEVKAVENNIKRVQNIITYRGEKRKDEYAARLAQPERRRFTKTQKFFATISGKAEANRKRAAEIRKKKSAGQKILDTIKADTELGGTKPEEQSES
ncbi:hypothetical protein IIC45_01600 [Patescibacteria group bacterium]|nr:hypothetical protein [Patescibacteria group bacterium]